MQRSAEGAGDLCGVDDTGCDEVFVLLGRCVKAEPIGIRIPLLRFIIGRFDRNIAGLTRFLLFLSKTQDRPSALDSRFSCLP